MNAQEKIEWLKERRSSIGASEAAAVLGLHPYHSPLSLYYEKTTGAEPAPEETEYQEWGHLLEEPIAQKYARVTGREVVAVKDPSQSFRHPVLPWITASPDRFYRLPERMMELLPLELKAADRYKPDDELPVHWQIQNQQQMAVTGAFQGSFGILGPFRKFYTADLERNEDFIKYLFQKLERFWFDHVLPRVPPPADGHQATTEALKRMFPTAEMKFVELPEKYLDHVQTLELISDKMKELEGKKDLLKNEIRLAMGDAAIGVFPDGSGYSCKVTKKEAYTVDATEYRTLRRIKNAIKTMEKSK